MNLGDLFREAPVTFMSQNSFLNENVHLIYFICQKLVCNSIDKK